MGCGTRQEVFCAYHFICEAISPAGGLNPAPHERGGPEGRGTGSSAGSAPASLTTGRAFLNPVKPDCEKEPGTMGPRVLATGCHPGHRHQKGLTVRRKEALRRRRVFPDFPRRPFGRNLRLCRTIYKNHTPKDVRTQWTQNPGIFTGTRESLPA